MPQVSVIMCVYNEDRFLAEAIESILKQTYRDFEFIIIDDGSTDNTAAILERYQEMDNRIKYCRRPHSGVLQSASYGCWLARGKYIARMDGDDIAFNHRFEKQVKFLDGHPSIAVLGGQMMGIDQNGITTFPVYVPTEVKEIKSALLSYNCINNPTVMMSTDAYIKVGGYRKPFEDSEEYDLWLRMAERYELANLKDYLNYYRFHSRKISVRHFEDQALSSLAARLAARARLETRCDPIAGIRQIERETLEKLGASVEMVTKTILEHSYWVIASMMHSGSIETARSILRELHRSVPTCYEIFAAYYGLYWTSLADEHLLANTIPSYLKKNIASVNFYLGYARSCYKCGNLLGAIKFAIKACTVDPSFLKIKYPLQYLETCDRNWNRWLLRIQKGWTSRKSYQQAEGHGAENIRVAKHLIKNPYQALLVLLDVYAVRLDLQTAFPEVLSKNYKRLLEWALGVTQKKWSDSDYDKLKNFNAQFKALLGLGEIADPSLNDWFYQSGVWLLQGLNRENHSPRSSAH